VVGHIVQYCCSHGYFAPQVHVCFVLLGCRRVLTCQCPSLLPVKGRIVCPLVSTLELRPVKCFPMLLLLLLSFIH
jgi:hypothetical protein